jgi:hypothetical protein
LANDLLKYFGKVLTTAWERTAAQRGTRLPRDLSAPFDRWAFLFAGQQVRQLDEVRNDAPGLILAQTQVA